MFHVDIELDRMIRSAKEKGASDLHFEALENGLVLRLRIDGLLEEERRIPLPASDQLINRIKVLSGLDIGERRIPQDGRWRWEDKDMVVVMRVSTMPSMYGETVVCRIMGNEGYRRSLAELDMSEVLLEKVRDVLHRPYGLLVVAGPTGSGKTSTLYAMLRELDIAHQNLVTLENPVESSIEGAVQVQINPKAGLTFANGLRAVLRQDPDTIMVGEIRDNETAALAIRAALTGHRVVSTIHTNTALGVIDRLVDMGVDRYLVEATLIGALSQRLVRRKCGDGYKGRMAIFEGWITPRTHMDWTSPEQYMVCTLAEAARQAVEEGDTTWDELHRVGITEMTTC